MTAPDVWIGANFWSRSGGPRMWTRYDPRVVRAELRVLADHGCTVTRSFCLWGDFVPEPGLLDEQVAARFADFLAAHRDAGLRTLPTPLVGHMSGENFDPPWRGGRDLYRDVTLVAEQAWFLEELARRFGADPAIAGWVLTNEAPLHGGEAPAEAVTAWARLLVQALRAGGATQPVSLGDGAWGVEATGRDNGFSLRALAPLVDVLGPHSYPMDDDPVRLALAPAFACELAAGFGRRVVLEEFGVSNAFASEEHAAAHYRQVLHTTLLAGARGWLAWANTDFDGLEAEDPYRHHPFELRFGLTRADGTPKPQLRELGSFAQLVRGFGHWSRAAADVALVVPEHFERVLPFTTQADRDDQRALLLQAYVAAREADLPVHLARERDGLPEGPRLLLAPCARQPTAPGLRRLEALAADGATVYLSYFAGSTPYQRGPWLAGLDELFGVRHRLRHGLADPVDAEAVVFELVQPLGELPRGTHLRFAALPEAAYLPLEPAGADVLAVDVHGRPALLRRPVGAGALVLCTHPLEHMAARTPLVNPEATWQLYSALASAAGVERPVHVPDPRVLCGRLQTDRGPLDVFVNCSDDQVAGLDPYGATAAAVAEGRDAAA